MVISRLRQCFIFSLTLLPIFYLSLCLQALSLSLSLSVYCIALKIHDQ